MASIGASAARALELAFGTNDIPVTATWRQSGGQPDVLHTHPGFSQLADEQARSRVYGGIHFQFDSDAGKVIGTKVADYVFAKRHAPERKIKNGAQFPSLIMSETLPLLRLR